MTQAAPPRMQSSSSSLKYSSAQLSKRNLSVITVEDFSKDPKKALEDTLSSYKATTTRLSRLMSGAGSRASDTKSTSSSSSSSSSTGRVSSILGSRSRSQPKSRGSLPAAPPVELTSLEATLQRWCVNAGVPFVYNQDETTRLTEDAKENYIYYLDSNTVMSIADLRKFAERRFPDKRQMEDWEWVFTKDAKRPVLQSYCALVGAKARQRVGRLRLKQTMKRKKGEIYEEVSNLENHWIDDMTRD